MCLLKVCLYLLVISVETCFLNVCLYLLVPAEKVELIVTTVGDGG